MKYFSDDMAGEIAGECRTRSGLRRRRRAMSGELSPADFVVSRHLDDPFVAAEIDQMVDQAEMLGIDLTDPEIMGAWLKDLVNKIKNKVKGKSASVNTGTGTVGIGPQGVTWTDNAPVALPATESPASKVAELVKNPMVIAAGVGIVALLIMSKKKRGRR